MIGIQEFFDGPVMELPLERSDENFEGFLSGVLTGYARAIQLLDRRCHLCARIRAAAPEIAQLSDWITSAVRQYLAGLPADVHGAEEGD